jgi:lipopolysaccharide transport system ATP-binding protein
LSQPAIVVENLSKKFRIGTGGGPAYHRLSELLTGLPRYAYNKLRPSRPALDPGSPRPASGRGAGGEGLTSESSPVPPTSSSLQPASDFWALRDVSFEVQPGEVVGIIGRNGAGKSTLLKILSRITEPTSGRFGVRGRVASLLEVGTGFHPELTGRENIYVSGITLGMTRAEIKKRFDEIVDFSGVEKFLETPVKHYSSGMQVRLGFAVAAHLESEILIVDEVLAVGDAEFQKKCLGKMKEVSGYGRTLLFVSHNTAAVSTLCERCILLSNGIVKQKGVTGSVLKQYLDADGGAVVERTWANEEDAPGTENVKLRRAEITSESSEFPHALSLSNDLTIRFEFTVYTEELLLNPSVVLQTSDGTIVLNTFPNLLTSIFSKPLSLGTYECAFKVPKQFLNDEWYRVQLHLIRDRSVCEFQISDVLQFEPIDDLPRTQWFGKWSGVVRPNLEWEAGAI